MKLTDLDNKPVTVAAKALKEHYGVPMNIERMPYGKAKAMLQKVRGLIAETKQTRTFYESQNNPNYLKMVFMEQALSKHIAQFSFKQPRIVFENEEVEKSQVILAAQDMVDSIQKMMEDTSEMLVKELPALVNGVQAEIGVNESEQFNSQTSEALTALQAALTQAKSTLQSALNEITGQGGGEAAQAFGGQPGEPTDVNVDINAEMPPEGGPPAGAAPGGGDEMPAPTPEEPEAMPVPGAGRTRR
jgi:hypothetical protein